MTCLRLATAMTAAHINVLIGSSDLDFKFDKKGSLSEKFKSCVSVGPSSELSGNLSSEALQI